MIKIDSKEQGDKLIEMIEEAMFYPVTVTSTSQGTLAFTEDAPPGEKHTFYIYKDGEVR